MLIRKIEVQIKYECKYSVNLGIQIMFNNNVENGVINETVITF